ncbi:hypothetical protein K1719_037057 [Acacia pycnantha]|nr:hypothetical protein K1719_037057 [Acacia pycnantha]
MCEEQERNLFVLKVQECLQQDLSSLLPGFSSASNFPKASPCLHESLFMALCWLQPILVVNKSKRFL